MMMPRQLTYALADDAVLGVEYESVSAALGALVQRLAGVALADLAAELVGAVAVRAGLATVERRATRFVTATQLVAVQVLRVPLRTVQQTLVCKQNQHYLLVIEDLSE